MGFFDDLGSDLGNIGEGLMGGGSGFFGDLGKGLGFLTPLGAVTGLGSIGGGLSGAMGDSSAFGGGGGSNPFQGLGAAGGVLASMIGGPGGGPGGAGAAGANNFYQGGATPDAMQTKLGPAAQAQGVDPRVAAAQQGLLGQLQAQASGQGPSLADMQMRAGMQQNAAQQASMAGASRNPALGLYNAGNAAAATNQGLASQGAMARLAEERQAQQGLAGLAGQMGQQDMNTNQFNASAQNQNQLAQGQLNQSQNQFYNNMMAGQYGGLQNFGYQDYLQQQQQANDLKKAAIGGALQAGGSLAQVAATGGG